MEADFTRAEPEQADALISIASETFRASYSAYNSEADMQAYLDSAFSQESVLRSLNDPDSETFFIRLGQEIIGYFTLNYNQSQTDLRDPEAVEVERIYLAGAYQGRGIGSLCFDFIVQRASQRGLSYIWISVWEKNEAAMRLYERQGFAKTGMHDFILGQDVQHDFIMKRYLS